MASSRMRTPLASFSRPCSRGINSDAMILARSRRKSVLPLTKASPASVAELQAKQLAILTSASRLLKPGGRLVYATCSLLADENQQVVAAFEADHTAAPAGSFAALRCVAAGSTDR